MSTELHYLDIGELGRALRAREFSCVELLEHLLARAGDLEPTLHAFLEQTPERAQAAARAADAQLAAGIDLGPLHGIPYVAKDLFDVAGVATTAGSRLLEGRLAERDGAVIRRLSAAGMVLLGKTHTVQFAYGGAGINHDHGTPHNPWAERHHLPGGSSSGSAVAVAAGYAPLGLGTDTGGSVRIPAALNGITGLKTTVGQVSRAGVFPLSWSLDSVGPLTRSVADAAHVYTAIQGPDADDPSTAGRTPHDVCSELNAGVKGLRIAFAESAFWEDADAEVSAAVRACGEVFRDLGAQVTSMEFPEAERARTLNPRGLVIAAEAYTLNRHWLDNHLAELDPAVATRMINGRDVLAHDYLQVTLQWERLRARAARVLTDEVDLLLCPASMIPALPVDEVDRDMDTYLARNVQYLRNTAIGNILGLTGLSVPCGFTAGGLPVGLMIYAAPFAEHRVLRAGHAFQQATDFHRRHPPLAWAA